MQQTTLLLYALGAPVLGLAIHNTMTANDTVPADDTVPEARNEELGRITWERNLETGLATATKADKPVLLLFQEIPG